MERNWEILIPAIIVLAIYLVGKQLDKMSIEGYAPLSLPYHGGYYNYFTYHRPYDRHFYWPAYGTRYWPYYRWWWPKYN